MKEHLRKIYGEEWTWLMSLSMSQKLKVAYFAISLVVATGVAECNWFLTTIILVNVVASALVVKDARIKGLKE